MISRTILPPWCYLPTVCGAINKWLHLHTPYRAYTTHLFWNHCVCLSLGWLQELDYVDPRQPYKQPYSSTTLCGKSQHFFATFFDGLGLGLGLGAASTGLWRTVWCSLRLSRSGTTLRAGKCPKVGVAPTWRRKKISQLRKMCNIKSWATCLRDSCGCVSFPCSLWKTTLCWLFLSLSLSNSLLLAHTCPKFVAYIAAFIARKVNQFELYKWRLSVWLV